MQAWKAFGKFIGSHLAFIAPICVALGVLFPSQLAFLKPWVTPLFAFMTFQGALGNNLSNLGRTFAHPAPMLVTLAVSTVAMPLVAFALGTLLFGGSPNLVLGIVLEYSVPVAVVSTMWIGMFGGDVSLGLATLLVSTVLSPVTIPLTLHVLLGQTVEVDVAGMMGDMLVQIALPALAGMVVNDLTRGRAKAELSPVLAPAAKVALVLVILSNSTGVSPYMRNLTPQLVGVIVFIGLFASTGYFWGLVIAKLWRRPRETMVTMTYQTGMRNISAGAVLAAQYFPGEVMFPVMMGTLFQQVLAACFGSFMRWLLAREDAALGQKGRGILSQIVEPSRQLRFPPARESPTVGNPGAAARGNLHTELDLIGGAEGDCHRPGEVPKNLRGVRAEGMPVQSRRNMGCRDPRRAGPFNRCSALCDDG